jgi:plasmid stabilization system protein ParE
MGRFLIAEPAKEDIAEIMGYLKTRSAVAARRVRLELRTAMQNLAAFPKMGHSRDDLADEPLRFWSVYSYLIAYRIEQRGIEIVRVLHGARDVGRLFRGS